jgi:hypothetical protein
MIGGELRPPRWRRSFDTGDLHKGSQPSMAYRSRTHSTIEYGGPLSPLSTSSLRGTAQIVRLPTSVQIQSCSPIVKQRPT